ncbi:amidase (hydantoinase/carbamoylase family) protein [Halosimplex carlsbadense 2-9-1]|uniref:Amidase (Hydantoinase/carbamoylase family) protein n=1 Tax=Halosimplex carlsbadense 2-9-1 TaxID=797114 RepID=M0D4Z3_9EURY|nr:Zn-dependent hydrolase [Halosimplex carlsbadense]ELZ30546.1 amidase (hydantoinase/carbamoylase family) protein [Halosimplex carlsbadense 2-9-1]
MTSEIPVDGDALRSDVERTAQFGAIDCEDGIGRTVLPGTQANARARSYLVDRMVAAGLEVRVDAVGNIAGRWAPPTCDPDAAPVAAGSHLDSVPEGGIFDGPLGVYAALESVRAIAASDLAVARPVEVVSFTGEEGTRFADGVLGSSVAAGNRAVDDALALSDGEVTLEAALDDIGFRGDERFDASEWDAWLELHVEQSGTLERAGCPVGVVDSITGTTRCRVTIEGEADHAGTTPMVDRTDALAAASELVLALEAAATEIATTDSESAVATVGSLSVEPGATNVVPGRAELSVDIRDVDPASIERLVDTLEATLSDLREDRGVAVAYERPYDIPPRPMADRVRGALRDATRRVDVAARSLHSGAGHDTMEVADATDAGLLFARSRGGHSHSPLEHTDWRDCTLATRVLATALADLAGATDA